MGLVELFNEWIVERGSAKVQEKHIALFRDQLAAAEKKISELTADNTLLKSKLDAKLKPQANDYSLLGVREILPSRHMTATALESVSNNTEKIKMLAISGISTRLTSTIDNKFANLRKAEIKCLLMSPDSSFVEVRQKENPSRSLAGLKSHILSGLDNLNTAKANNPLNNFEIKIYNEHPVYRMVIVDDLAYVSYYPKGGPPDEVPVLVIEKGKSWLYEASEKYFDSIWDRAVAFSPH